MVLVNLFTVFLIITSFLLVFFSNSRPEVIFGFAFIALLVIGALPVEKAFLGLSNPGVITLICFFVIAGAIRTTGALDSIIAKLIEPKYSGFQSQLKLLAPISLLSAFFNNTPIVASVTPVVVDWCKKYSISPSKFLLPLSYAAILGGTCTIIGTFTNLVILGILNQSHPQIEFGFFEIALIGLPITFVGLIYLSIFAKVLLEDRELVNKVFEDVREYVVNFRIKDDSQLSGKSISDAGLRGLHSVYLSKVMREHVPMSNLSADFILRANDILEFTGSVSSINDLVEMNGLIHVEDQIQKLDDTINTELVEIIISDANPLIGQTIKQTNFRKRNNAVIISVVRNGKRIDKKTGDIVFTPGDLLLIQASPSFIEKHRYSREFMLLSGSSKKLPKRSTLSPIAWASLIGSVLLAAFNILPIVVAALLGALVVVATKCITFSEVRRAIDFKVIALIVFAFGFGEALQETGVTTYFASQLIEFNQYGPFALLVGVYLLTLLMTEMITNNAAAVINFSLVAPLVQELELNIIPFAVAIMIAASASFITPLGYQTNLIVYSAGNYRFSDYLKLGLPLSILVMIISLTLIPMIWPF